MCPFTRFYKFLNAIGLRRTAFPSSAATCNVPRSLQVRLFILIYVDDLVIAGNDSSAVAQFKAYLGNCFYMKDLGPLKYFLGLEVARSAEGIYISQRKYALDIISETELLGCKPAATPMEQHHGLGSATGPLLDNIESYRRLVGRLVYLAVTRLVICCSYSLSSFINRDKSTCLQLFVLSGTLKVLQAKEYYFGLLALFASLVGAIQIGVVVLPREDLSRVGLSPLAGLLFLGRQKSSIRCPCPLLKPSIDPWLI